SRRDVLALALLASRTPRLASLTLLQETPGIFVAALLLDPALVDERPDHLTHVGALRARPPTQRHRVLVRHPDHDDLTELARHCYTRVIQGSVSGQGAASKIAR